MGLTNHDSYTAPSGVIATNTYILEENDVSVHRKTDTYEIYGTYKVYLSKADYINGCRPIHLKPLNVSLDIGNPLGSVYDILTTELQTLYPNHTVE